MSWILLAIGLIISSVLYYLVLRRSKDAGFSVDEQTLAMFSLPMVFMGIFCFFSGRSFDISTQNLLIILGNAIFFSWFGNRLSLMGINRAPNQGYSLVISKGYVIMNAVLSVWLFDSPLPPKSIISILLVMVFSGLILIDKPSDKKKSSEGWILPTVLAFFAFGFQALVMKYLINVGVDSLVILFYILVVLLIMFIGNSIISKKKFMLKGKGIYWLLLISILYIFFNVFMLYGYEYAPNPGYVSAANIGSVALVTIFSALIFKDDLNRRKVFGVIGVVCSLVLLFI
jgi:drug/metabolite transporter (DMT)-like permease